MDKRKIVETMIAEGCDLLGKTIEDMVNNFTIEQLHGYLECFRKMKKFYKKS